VTQLRKMMLQELQRRNYSQTTVKGYLKIVESFAKYFHCPTDQLGPEQPVCVSRYHQPSKAARKYCFIQRSAVPFSLPKPQPPLPHAPGAIANSIPEMFRRLNTHSLPRPPQTRAAPFKRLYLK
jgi:hypothetical protein